MTRTLLVLAAGWVVAAASCDHTPSADPAPEADPAIVAQLQQRVDALRVRVEADSDRAAEFRALEFFGDIPPARLDSARIEIVACPDIPDPATSEYPDCIGLFEVRLEQQHGLVATPVYHDRKLALPMADAAPGDTLELRLVPWQSMPDWVRSIQRVSANEDPALPVFAVLGFDRASAQTSVRHIIQPLRGDGPSQAAWIERTRATLEASAARHGGDFDAWRRELRPAIKALSIKTMQGAILTNDSCFRHWSDVEHRDSDSWPEPQIRALTSLRDQLAERGIELLIAPFPDRELFTGIDVLEPSLRPADGILDVGRQRMHLQLNAAGLEVIDAHATMLAAARTGSRGRLHYPANDDHPADGTIQIMAELICERLQRFKFAPEHRAMRKVVQAYGIPERYKDFPPAARIENAFSATVFRDSEGNELRASDTSRLLILGDSFSQVPSNYGVRGGDLASHIAARTGIVPKTLTVGGSGPAMARHLAGACPEILRGVRVVIYAVRESGFFRHTSAADEQLHWSCPELPEH